MTRKIFETAQDLDAESEVASILEREWNCTARKLPTSYRADFMFETKSGAVAWVEIKNRNFHWGKFPTIILSMGKCLAMRSLSETSGLPAILAVSTLDHIHWARIDNRQWVPRWGGRVCQTRDPADIEPVIEIPLEMFQQVHFSSADRPSRSSSHTSSAMHSGSSWTTQSQ